MNGLVSMADNHIAFSGKVGGARAIYEGHPHILVGGCMFKLNQLPLYPAGILPAGTPIYVDEVARTFDIHYAFEVLEAPKTTSATTKKTFSIKKGLEGSRIQVGMILMAAQTDVATTAAAGFTVVSVDTTNDAYDVVVVDADITAVATANAVLWEAKASASGGTYEIKVKPNALTDRDKVKYAETKMVDGAAVFGCDGAVLANRIPPVTAAVKAYMRGNDCFFRWSNHQ